MQKIRDIPWFRIGAESTAIVASILLAFAIDAWWVERQDRRTQTEELNRLHEEFTRIHEEFGTETDGQEQIHASVVELFQIVQAHNNRTEPIELPNELLTRAISSVTVDIATPVLDGLVLSGRLESIRAEGVVSAIAGWQKALSELQEIELTSRGLLLARLVPELTERANMGNVLARKDPDGDTLVLVDDELEGHLGYRLQSTRLVNTRLDSLVTSLDEVLGAIVEAQQISATGE